MSFRKAPTRVSATIGGKEIILETGRVATQAHGSVTIQCGGTVVLVTVCSQPLDFDRGFFPLTVEYSERMYAAGRIPGSFFRREIGRPSERETLVSRLIDRPIRPLFPKGLPEDVQVLASVISSDRKRSDVLSITAASAAVMLSPLPFAGSRRRADASAASTASSSEPHRQGNGRKRPEHRVRRFRRRAGHG